MRCLRGALPLLLLQLLGRLAASVAAAAAASEEDFAGTGFAWKHHDNMELNQILQRVAHECGPIASIYELSERSVNGWPLTVLELSDRPGVHEPCKLLELLCLLPSSVIAIDRVRRYPGLTGTFSRPLGD